jgi:hypothetical protein
MSEAYRITLLAAGCGKSSNGDGCTADSDCASGFRDPPRSREIPTAGALGLGCATLWSTQSIRFGFLSIAEAKCLSTPSKSGLRV